MNKSLTGGERDATHEIPTEEAHQFSPAEGKVHPRVATIPAHVARPYSTWLSPHLAEIGERARSEGVRDVAPGGKRCWEVLHPGRSGRCEACIKPHFPGAEGAPDGVRLWEFRDAATGRWYRCWDLAVRWVDGRPVRPVIDAPEEPGKNGDR